jgi:hypothetical protein
MDAGMPECRNADKKLSMASLVLKAQYGIVSFPLVYNT